MNQKYRSDSVIPSREFQVRPSNLELESRADRLRSAVKQAGGNLAVAQRSGVPLGTLNKYIAGRELPTDNLIALAHACGVSLEWLATGAGPGQTVTESRPSAPPPAAPPLRLFNVVHIGKLAGAMEAVIDNFESDGTRPPMEKIVRAALLLYDIMNEPDAPAPEE